MARYSSRVSSLGSSSSGAAGAVSPSPSLLKDNIKTVKMRTEIEMLTRLDKTSVSFWLAYS